MPKSQRFKTQDPKYDIEVLLDESGEVHVSRLVNAATGIPIPEDEPIMLLRAKDKHALPTIYDYAERIADPEHGNAVFARAQEFHNFRERFPELMKEPDTTTVAG